MATDPPKKRTGPSKKHQDASEELRIHMALRNNVNRLVEMVNRQEQATSSTRELIDRINDDLKKQGEKFMTRVEDAGIPSTDPPPPPETQPSIPQPKSMRPTVTVEAFNARTFERTIRTRYKEASTHDERELVLEGLRYAIDHTPGYAADLRIQALETELRRS